MNTSGVLVYSVDDRQARTSSLLEKQYYVQETNTVLIIQQA
jgi:hypothetical protein